MDTRISLYLVPAAFGCLIVLLVHVSYEHIATALARRSTIRKHGCEKPPALPLKDPFFGLDLVRDSIYAAKTKTSIARQLAQYTKYGNTFSSRFFMTPVINTIDPENITTILTTRFDDYGVGSRRKEAFAPLLGKSIFQVDGPQWKHSRGLIRPCFSKAQVENLPKFDVHVTNLIKAIPKDGWTWENFSLA